MNAGLSAGSIDKLGLGRVLNIPDRTEEADKGRSNSGLTIDWTAVAVLLD